MRRTAREDVGDPGFGMHRAFGEAGFAALDVTAGAVRFAGVRGGSGPPVLLLHGFPQTHLAWRFVAPALARSFTVVAPDLPGYGDSTAAPDGPRWSKRRAAAAIVDLMLGLGHTRFAVVGHDRGARVGYRIALDRPDAVTAFASLAVVPTIDVWPTVDRNFATNAFHWFLLAQPQDLQERLLAADPDAFLEHVLAKMAGGLDRIDADALAAYRAAFRNPAVRRAICEDYRAAIDEDSAHDAADRAAGKRLECPVLVLWPEGRPSTVEIWRRWADDVRGSAVAGGHLLPEERPHDVLAALERFLPHPPP